MMDLVKQVVGLLAPFAAAVVAGVIVALGREAISWMQNQKMLALDAAQNAEIEQAVDTAAGMLQHQLQTGVVKLSELQPASAHTQPAINHVLETVPTALAFFGVTPATVEAKVLANLAGRLGVDPTVPGVNPPQPSGGSAS